MTPALSALLRKSLDGLSMRSIATAQNIANANSARYRPVSVSFERALQAASAEGADAIGAMRIAQDESKVEVKGSAVRLDLELQTASETSMRYGALIDMLGRALQLERAIIRGGQ